MGQAIYRIVPHRDGWAVDHDGKVAGDYAAKEAAFEAAAAAASNAIKQGHDVELTVPGVRATGGSALGS